MLSGVLKLWVVTALIVDTEQFKFVKYAARKADPFQHAQTGSLMTNDGYMNPAEWTVSPKVLDIQIRVALEELASNLTRSISAELDGRLIRKTEFKNFLATILFLNCQERMRWKYRAVAEEVEDRNEVWPLVKPEVDCVKSFDEYLRVLKILNTIRNVVPYMVADPDTGLMEPQEAVSEDIQDWYVNCAIADNLHLGTNQIQFSAEDHRSYDGKFFNELLAPCPMPANVKGKGKA
jgi:hypothetical protein